MTNIRIENDLFIAELPIKKWWFSIMLVYQKVLETTENHHRKIMNMSLEKF